MQESLSERQVLVLAHLKARAEGDDADAEEIRGFGKNDPELARMFDEADEEAAHRSTQDSRLIALLASFFERLFGGASRPF